MRSQLPCYIFLAFGLSACAFRHDQASPPLSPQEHSLLGTWRSDLNGDHWIITRRSDRTFTERRTTDYPAPGTSFTSTGRWHVADDVYDTRYLSVTEPYFARKLVGHEIHARIHSLTNTRFVFQHEDAAVVSEQKISSLSDRE